VEREGPSECLPATGGRHSPPGPGLPGGRSPCPIPPSPAAAARPTPDKHGGNARVVSRRVLPLSVVETKPGPLSPVPPITKPLRNFSSQTATRGLSATGIATFFPQPDPNPSVPPVTQLRMAEPWLYFLCSRGCNLAPLSPPYETLPRAVQAHMQQPGQSPIAPHRHGTVGLAATSHSQALLCGRWRPPPRSAARCSSSTLGLLRPH